MSEELKKAFQEMQEAINKVDELCCWEDYDPNKPNCYLDTEAIADAFQEEKAKKIKYHTFFFQRVAGWPQERIDEWLKKAGLK